eukprot:768517-Hanusia_phi.AAC.3
MDTVYEGERRSLTRSSACRVRAKPLNCPVTSRNMLEATGRDSGKEVTWKDTGVPCMKVLVEKLRSVWMTVKQVSGAQICKTRDTPDFAVGLGEKVYSQGQHELEFAINRYGDGYVYVGVAIPVRSALCLLQPADPMLQTINLQQTWCRRCATDQVTGSWKRREMKERTENIERQVWYYFGCGYTNALRNGWEDIVSKEVPTAAAAGTRRSECWDEQVGGPEMKVPKLQVGDRVKAQLDMDNGQVYARKPLVPLSQTLLQLRFSIFKVEEGVWKDVPGMVRGVVERRRSCECRTQLEGIKTPVVAACCIQVTNMLDKLKC